MQLRIIFRTRFGSRCGPFWRSPTVFYPVWSTAGAPGWNVKYKKGSRALCTLYPRLGYFTCMVSVGRKETVQAELLLPSFDPYLQALYQKADVFNGGRWLMIDVISEPVLENVKELIQLRVKPNKQ